MSWGQFLGKLSTYLPGRIEKLKNEKQRLLNERKNILDLPASVDRSIRVGHLDNRLSEINAILGNKAVD